MQSQSQYQEVGHRIQYPVQAQRKHLLILPLASLRVLFLPFLYCFPCVLPFQRLSVVSGRWLFFLPQLLFQPLLLLLYQLLYLLLILFLPLSCQI